MFGLTKFSDKNQENDNTPLVVIWSDVKQEQNEGTVEEEKNPEIPEIYKFKHYIYSISQLKRYLDLVATTVHISDSEEDAAFLERDFLAPRFREAKLDMEAFVFEQIF